MKIAAARVTGATVGRVRAALAAFAAFAIVAMLAACGGSARTVPALPRLGVPHDVYDGDFGDPFMIQNGPTVVLFGTDDPPSHIPTATSTDLVGWNHRPDAVPVLPTWADPDPRDELTWAPAAATVGGRHLLYVTVQDASAHRQCIAVLGSATALGPYRDAKGSPLVCQVALGGSIDPSVTTDGGGLRLVWKSDGNCCGLPASLWEQDLRADGLAVTGSPHLLLNADQPWQGGIVENPALLRASRGGWWLFYSGNRFDRAAYATGLAWCATPHGPCRVTGALPFLTGPFVSGSGTQYSPGGLDFFRDAHGELWAAFATWNRPPRGGQFFCCRSLDLAPVLSS